MFRRIITASIRNLVTKISSAKLTPLRIPLAGLGVVCLAMGLPVFPAAALEVTMTMSGGDSNNAGANWTATVCYDTANQFEFNETPLFIRYFPAKMTFILEPDLENPGIGDGGTIVHEEVRVVFELTADGPNFTVTNDVLEGWDGQLDGKDVSNVILKMNSSLDTKYDLFDLDSAFDFNPISFTAPDFLGGANYTYLDGSETQGFDGTFYSFVEGEPCPLDPEPTDPEVKIDIKPGSFPNSINLGSGGAIPVAILGSATLDVNDIDIDTLVLSSAMIKTVGTTERLLCSLDEDVSGNFDTVLGLEGAPDGFPDLVCHFLTVNLVPEEGDTQATLSGSLFDGTPFEATDSVNVVQEIETNVPD